ncbi:MAG: SDR family NAD(P)-dependent oxidoreductase, partial [Pseudobdellovibrio sp.]
MKSNKVQKKIKIDKEISTHKKLLKKTYTLISGASSGIGEQTAYLLAEKSENLILIARRTRKLKAIQKKCLSLGALSVEIFQCDLTRVSDIKKLESKFRDQKISIS